MIKNFFSALIPVLDAALAQNTKFCEHLKVFQGAGLLVKALLDAVVREPKKKEMYMEEVQEGSRALALQVLVLPHSVPSSAAVAKLEVSLALFGEGGEMRGLKRAGESTGEGSEERRKQAWRGQE